MRSPERRAKLMRKGDRPPIALYQDTWSPEHAPEAGTADPFRPFGLLNRRTSNSSAAARKAHLPNGS